MCTKKGTSSYRKVIIAVLRKTFCSRQTKRQTFIKIFFNETVKNRISLPNLSFENFFEMFQSTLDYFAPYNQKKIKYNNNDGIALLWQKTKKRNHVKVHNKFNKSRTSVNLQNYREQRNKCTKVLRNAKQQYFNNLNSKILRTPKNSGKLWNLSTLIKLKPLTQSSSTKILE